MTKYIGSFCEINLVSDSKKICTGYIAAAGEHNIYIPNMLRFSTERDFEGIITLLSKERGLRVFRAHVAINGMNNIAFDDMTQIVNTERRADYRAIVDLPALAVIKTEPTVGYDAIIKDMSVRGISLWLHKSFEIEDAVNIQFVLNPDDKFIHSCNCNIVRFINKPIHSFRKYGCEFMDLTPESHAAIRAFVTKKRTEVMQQQLFE